MISKTVILSASAMVVLAALAFASDPYQPHQTYNDAYNEEPAMDSYQPHSAPAYQPQSQYKAPSYHQAAPSYHQAAPSYHQAPAYPKYHAPSSAHHTQYDNYIPKQTNYPPPRYSAPKAPVYEPSHY